ncbi:MAG: EAL domain-containing protein, partial [Candidatus Thiodiazotropha endolucinida]
DPADCELVNASILMAHGLGLEVVAEGVEIEDQLSQLRDMQCEYAQGYLFSRPVSAEAFTELLQNSAKMMSSVI